MKTVPPASSKGYVAACAVAALCTCVGLALRGLLDPVNLVMLYLLGIVLIAARYQRSAAMLAVVVSALSFDFFLVEPYFSFAITDIQYVITFLVLLITGLVISALTSQLAEQSAYFATKERHTAALYAVARKLASARGADNMLYIIRSHVEEAFGGTASVWLAGNGTLHCLTHPALNQDIKEQSAALFAYEHQQEAGLGTATPTGARGFYLPLKGAQSVLGVLGFEPPQAEVPASDKVQLEAVAHVAASALERASVAEMAEKHKVEAEGEKLRNAMLSAVSHDFRTPLASIKGVISSLLMEDNRMSDADKKELLASAHGETARLERIVSNLLEVTLLESGKLKLKKDYYFLPELVGNALKQTQGALAGRPVTCKIAPDVPALYVDGLLIEQVLVNLLENAGKYTPEATPISIVGNAYGSRVTLMIEDHGAGIPEGDEEKIFDTFHTASARKGSGLGLAICRGIVQAHGGEIHAANRSGGGAVFTIILPAGAPPAMVDA